MDRTRISFQIATLIAFAPNQVETAELFSKMTGTATVQKASFNFSGSRFSPVMSHVNASVDHIERPLMTPDEIMRLRPPKKEGNGDSEVITEPGDMLIFVPDTSRFSGCRCSTSPIPNWRADRPSRRRSPPDARFRRRWRFTSTNLSSSLTTALRPGWSAGSSRN